MPGNRRRIIVCALDDKLLGRRDLFAGAGNLQPLHLTDRRPAWFIVDQHWKSPEIEKVVPMDAGDTIKVLSLCGTVFATTFSGPVQPSTNAGCATPRGIGVSYDHERSTAATATRYPPA